MIINEIEKLPDLDILKIQDYEYILKENIENLKKIDPDWIPVESDNRMALIRLFSYKELLQQKREQLKLKSILWKYSQGDSLTHIIYQMTGVLRKEGEYPVATYIIKLTQSLSENYLIEKGYQVRDNDGNIAELADNAVFLVGETDASCMFNLKEYCKESNVQPSTPIINIPYVKAINIKEGEHFKGGSYKESDNSLLKRAYESRYKFTTTGSEQAYLFYVYQADSRIIHARARKAGENEVEIVFLPEKIEITEAIKNNIENNLYRKEIKPLTDYITVRLCKIKVCKIKVKSLGDPFTKKDKHKIEELLSQYKSLIGKGISISEIYLMIVKGFQKRFEIIEPLASIFVEEGDAIKLEVAYD